MKASLLVFTTFVLLYGCAADGSIPALPAVIAPHALPSLQTHTA
jgi:hypothetical protein